MLLSCFSVDLLLEGTWCVVNEKALFSLLFIYKRLREKHQIEFNQVYCSSSIYSYLRLSHSVQLLDQLETEDHLL